MAICVICETTFKAKRPDARCCSPRCRKAASRRGGGGQDSDVTDNPMDGASDTCDASTRLQSVHSRMSGEPFIFKEDTVPGRRWRVADGWLECDVMGGWKRVFEVADSTDLARSLVWLSGANIVGDRGHSSPASPVDVGAV
jgi:hypothetical protein